MKSENFLVITFNDDSKAIEASHRLQDLAMRGDISLGYNVMLKKNADGKIEAMKKETAGGRTTWTGMLIGMLVGLFMGPFGFLLSTGLADPPKRKVRKAVRSVQQILRAVEIRDDAGRLVVVDGRYGPQTAQAVSRNAQRVKSVSDDMRRVTSQLEEQALALRRASSAFLAELRAA